MPTQTLSVVSIKKAPAQPLLGMDREALSGLMRDLSGPAYRGRQLADAIYRQRVAKLDDVSTLPEALRQKLAGAGFAIGLPELAQTFYSVDGTERYLVELADGETVEAVWMPNGDGAADELDDAPDAVMANAVISTEEAEGRRVEKPAVLPLELAQTQVPPLRPHASREASGRNDSIGSPVGMTGFQLARSRAILKTANQRKKRGKARLCWQLKRRQK
jgi:hypothetical protein